MAAHHPTLAKVSRLRWHPQRRHSRYILPGKQTRCILMCTGVPPARRRAERGMFERFTDRARRAVVLAQEEARMLNHNYIGTEHLLLGLIHEGEGVAAQALESLGISLEAVRPAGRGDHRPGPARPGRAHPVHAAGQEGAGAVAARGAGDWATTTSAPSTSCSGCSVRATAWPRRCWCTHGRGPEPGPPAGDPAAGGPARTRMSRRARRCAAREQQGWPGQHGLLPEIPGRVESDRCAAVGHRASA